MSASKLACVMQEETFILYSLNNMSTLLEVRNKSTGALLENIAVPASLSDGASISNFCPNSESGVLSYIVSSTADPGSIYQCDLCPSIVCSWTSAALKL